MERRGNDIETGALTVATYSPITYTRKANQPERRLTIHLQATWTSNPNMANRHPSQ